MVWSTVPMMANCSHRLAEAGNGNDVLRLKSSNPAISVTKPASRREWAGTHLGSASISAIVPPGCCGPPAIMNNAETMKHRRQSCSFIAILQAFISVYNFCVEFADRIIPHSLLCVIDSSKGSGVRACWLDTGPYLAGFAVLCVFALRIPRAKTKTTANPLRLRSDSKSQQTQA